MENCESHLPVSSRRFVTLRHKTLPPFGRGPKTFFASVGSINYKHYNMAEMNWQTYIPKKCSIREENELDIRKYVRYNRRIRTDVRNVCLVSFYISSSMQAHVAKCRVGACSLKLYFATCAYRTDARHESFDGQWPFA